MRADGRIIAAAALTAALVAGGARGASAQEAPVSESRNFAAQRLRLSMDRGGLLDLTWAGIDEERRLELSFFLKYADDPLIVKHTVNDRAKRAGSLLQNLFDADLAGAVMITSWLEVGAGTSITLYQGRPESISFADVSAQLASISTLGFGDIWIDPKLRILNGRSQGIDLAIMPGFTIPTGQSKDYLGDTGFTFTPRLLIGKAFGAMRLGLDAGVRIRKEAAVPELNMLVENALVFRVGAGVRFGKESDERGPFDIGFVLSGDTSLTSPFGEANQTPLEALLSFAYELTPSAQLTLGGGVGLLEGAGSPDYRFLAGVRWALLERKDTDGDGLFDDEDNCPRVPGPRENVGCPWPDTDGDGLIDPEDACPKEPGPRENKGCPIVDKDTDGDGIFDSTDKCVEQPEDKDGFEDEDGCPDIDNDKDGVVDAKDKCPMEPGPVENQGCPDQDTDGDTVVDRIDNCPTEPGPPENHGCQKKQLVVIHKDRLEILDKVYFKTDKAEIDPRSFGLLNNVADVVKSHPEIQRIRVEGHTDNVGTPEYNLDLSQRRAESVVSYLIGRGIQTSRLVPVGYGLTQPRASNATRAGKAMNRRVEFIIPEEGPVTDDSPVELRAPGPVKEGDMPEGE